MKEYGEKIPEEKKTAISTALESLKKAHEAKDFAAIDTASEELNKAWQAASQDMYAATNAENAGASENGGTTSPGGEKTGSDETVQDVDFEEVK